ncbi:MAG: c-type cytochrome [Terriglobales bacterium]
MRMYWFLLGVLATVVVILAGGYLWVRLGFVDPRADIPVSAAEARLMGPAMDASVRRRAPQVRNPLAANPATLVQGMQVYQADCALCHGDAAHPSARLADALYPRPPQFLVDPADMPEAQNYYIVQHGVRMTGMPAWGEVLDQRQIWTVVTFLSHMAQLPPEVRSQWLMLAAAVTGVGAEPALR